MKNEFFFVLFHCPATSFPSNQIKFSRTHYLELDLFSHEYSKLLKGYREAQVDRETINLPSFREPFLNFLQDHLFS